MRVLTHTDAIARAKSVLPGIQYKYYLNFQKGKHFHGSVLATFALSNLENVFLDFSGKEITSFQVNDHEVISDEESIKKYWVTNKLQLNSEWLHLGSNTVEICFKNDYNTDGNGLHTFNDLDSKQYVYTQTEPYYCNKIFPIFDQPDLKGYVKFYLMHPSDWKAISNNQSEVEFHDLKLNLIQMDPFMRKQNQLWGQDFENDSQTLTVFKTTKRLSSYLFSIVLGPFEFVELPVAERYRNIPMRIYFRKSLEKYAVPQSKYFFECCTKAVEFYESFFGVEYPFSKLDSAFCPEFSVGAMEYPGIVTYNDSFIRQVEQINKSQISALLRVVCHELAHMWFGNLVTMQWWDGLWLNESFAEFITYKCKSEIQKTFSFETKDAWIMMNISKNWGYKTDANVTTHPIDCVVNDTIKAEGIFDGITYSKGASTILQLYYYMGDEIFRKSIKEYFQEFQWKNTNLEDLLKHLQKNKEDSDLKEWNRQWIMTAGTNTVSVEWDPSVEGKQKINVCQGVLLEDHPTLRYHKLDLAFYDENGKLALVKSVELLPQAKTEVEIENKNFKAVLPNANDWTFCSIVLDPVSRDFFTKNLNKLDELSNLLIVRSLFNDVKQAKIKADVFIDILVPMLELNLNNPNLMKEFGEFIIASISYIPYALREPFKVRLFSTIWKLAEAASDPKIMTELRDLLLYCSSNAENITLLYKAAYQENEVGKKMKFEGRELVNVHYFAIMIPGVDPEIKEQAKKRFETDSKTNENFKKRKFTIDVLLKSHEEKVEIWNSQIVNPKRTLSWIELIYSLLGIKNKYNSEESRKFFLTEYFRMFPEVVANDTKQIIDCFYNYGMPYWEDVEFVLSQFQELLPKLKEIKNENAVNKVRTKIDDLQNLLKAFALYK
jgi:aminopeptidase N